LRTTFLTIKQILKQVGLGSNAHFVHDFRKLYGITPTAYRRTMGRHAKRRRQRKKKRSAKRGKI
jgi:AraC-like DNA-binding protein